MNMLKNKFKALIITLLLLIISISSFCFADLEEDLVQSGIIENSETTEESIDIQPNLSNNLNVANNNLLDNNNINNTKKSDVYLVGWDINIDYNIEGNLYVLGFNVNISSKVLGNAFICANNLNITNTGYISNSLYAAVRQLDFNGKSYDIYSCSDVFNFNGSTFRDINSNANHLNINGIVGRSAYISSDNILINGKIENDLYYTSNEQITIPNGLVNGHISYTKSDDTHFKINVFSEISSFIILVVITWLLMKLFTPKFLANTDTIIKERPIYTFFKRTILCFNYTFNWCSSTINNYRCFCRNCFNDVIRSSFLREHFNICYSN